MNVLAVDQFGEIGGAQKCLLDLLTPCIGRSVDAAGGSARATTGEAFEELTLIAAVPDGSLARAARDIGFESIPIPCGPYALGRKTAADALRFCLDTLRQRAILRRVIERRSIDVVYVNGPRVLAGAVLAARARCRVVFHAHNYLSRWHDRAVVRFALNRGASAIACCDYVAKSIGQVGSLPNVIHNGVPDAGFRPRQHPPGRPWRVGIVGRISPEKGHLALMQAVRRLSQDGLQITLVVAGAAQFSPPRFDAEVRRQAAGLDVQFTGWTNDVSALLGGLDLLAVPSIAEPGLPRVVLEAFSAGVPVVAAPTGGIPEAVRDNESGFLASDATAEALAARLRSVMIAPPAEVTRVALYARAEWERRWNAERWRREVLCVIRGSQPAPAQALQQSREQGGRMAPQARPG